jgi:hypothetical protein
MPLYKMTEKRLAKRAKEDEEGMTELKAVIGPESGSEESVSEGSSSGSAEEGEDGQMDSEDGERDDQSASTLTRE